MSITGILMVITYFFVTLILSYLFLCDYFEKRGVKNGFITGERAERLKKKWEEESHVPPAF